MRGAQHAVEDAAAQVVLKSYLQTFIDAVRATGGNNSSRTLIIQGPSTDIEKTNQLMTSLPTDNIADRLMAEVHFYPYQYTLMTEDEALQGVALADGLGDFGEEDFEDDDLDDVVDEVDDEDEHDDDDEDGIDWDVFEEEEEAFRFSRHS